MNSCQNIEYVIDLVSRVLSVELEEQAIRCSKRKMFREDLDDATLPDWFEEVYTDDEVIMHSYDVGKINVYIIANSEDDYWFFLGALSGNELIYTYTPGY